MRAVDANEPDANFLLGAGGGLLCAGRFSTDQGEARHQGDDVQHPDAAARYAHRVPSAVKR